MFIYITSIFSVLVLTSYLLFLLYRHPQTLSKMLGMMVSMGTAMMVSLLLGTLLGVFYQQMTLSTIYAVLIGITVGYTAGKPIHLIAVLDGLLTGIMGGMMGAMLGVMVASESPVLLIGFLNLVFIGVMLLLIRLVYLRVLEEKSSSESYSRKPSADSEGK